MSDVRPPRQVRDHPLAPSGIRVNVLSPGIISTPGSYEFSKTIPGFSPDDWLRNIPLGRIGATEDIAEVVALLVAIVHPPHAQLVESHVTLW
ncbi:SDR family oxidoreductase [Paralcaligenes ginsengisoli]